MEFILIPALIEAFYKMVIAILAFLFLERVIAFKDRRLNRTGIGQRILAAGDDKLVDYVTGRRIALAILIGLVL